jgi:LmbE family N-acetylglucosaminyl deacetylase
MSTRPVRWLTFAMITAAAATTAAAKAGPLSIGASHQMQVGWVRTSQSATRLTRLLEEGTAGQNIQPASGDGNFQTYGANFIVSDPNNSFDYRSTLRDTTTVSDVQAETITIYATQSNTYNSLNTAPLGYFQQGNSAF